MHRTEMAYTAPSTKLKSLPSPTSATRMKANGHGWFIHSLHEFEPGLDVKNMYHITYIMEEVGTCTYYESNISDNYLDLTFHMHVVKQGPTQRAKISRTTEVWLCRTSPILAL